MGPSKPQKSGLPGEVGDGGGTPRLDATLPDVETFGRLVAPSTPRHHAVAQLYALLVECRPGAPLSARTEALERLVRWLLGRRSVPATAGEAPGDTPQTQRVRLLLRAIEQAAALGQRLAFTLERCLADGRGTGLFARLGLPTDRGLFAETVDRVSRRFLPEPRDDADLRQLVGRLFPSRRALRALASLPPELVQDLASAMRLAIPGHDPWAPLREHVVDASLLVAARVSALGLSDALGARSAELGVSRSPFFRLPRAVDRLVEASGGAPDTVHDLGRGCRALTEECRAVCREVVENLERHGVSVDVVYRLELAQKCLARLDLLLVQLEPGDEITRAKAARSLLVALVDLGLRDRQLSEIVRENLHLLARKIIERAGHTGEHYITSTRAEYAKMLLSAGGGGVLTAGTTALKFTVTWGHYAPFVEGALHSINYAASFLLMQLAGFTLATKQPSMTAAALAGTLRESAGHPDLSALVTLIARITRSQLAAAIGNIGLVVPSAVAFDQCWRWSKGHAFFDETTAHYVLHSLHPTESGTAFFAALTGVTLWASSLVAGWLENWAVYRRIPEAIADHRFGRVLGRRTMRWLSGFYVRNIAGFGGNVAIGVMLGMTPVIGKFFGLPLDVRHVTLSTGSLTLAVLALGGDALSGEALLAAVAGIGVVGVFDFGVSFVLALLVALRARQVDRADRLRLLVSVAATFARSPLQFFLPPRGERAADVHGPVSIVPPVAGAGGDRAR